MKYFLITCFILCISCNKNTEINQPTDKADVRLTNSDQEQITKVALSFINAYVNNCNNLSNSDDVQTWISKNTFTTTAFNNELKKIMDQAYKLDPELGLGADPIFDAQDYPDQGFEFDSIDKDLKYIVLKGKNWADFKLTLKMIKEKETCLVDGCGIINVPDSKRSPR